MQINTPAYEVELQLTGDSRATSGNKASTSLRSATAFATKSVDLVDISSRSRELARLKKDLSALPDIRLDRVALAKQQLQQGTNQVDSSQLAQKMVDSVVNG